MIVKPCVESKELRLFQSLHARMDLVPDDHQHYLNLKKGFEGELKFNQLLQDYPNGWLIINDLLLVKSNNTFQIDTLLISQKEVFHFEVKNFYGDYYIEKNKWYVTTSKIEIVNPISQLEKSQTLLQRLLLDFGCKLPLESYLIFINPQFMLYNAPVNPSIIFPAQLERFMMKKMNVAVGHVNDSHIRLGEKFISNHITDSKFSRVPPYCFDGLRKGLFCPACSSLLRVDKEMKLTRGTCGKMEGWEQVLLRSVDEFKLLFPGEKITTNRVYVWCGGIKSKKAIRRVLTKHLTRSGHANRSHFITK